MLTFRRSAIIKNEIITLDRLAEWWNIDGDYVEYNYSEIADLDEFEKQLGWLMSLGAHGFIEVEAELGEILKYELISNKQVDLYSGIVVFQYSGLIAQNDI